MSSQKQVIASIRNQRGRLIAKMHFYTVDQYNDCCYDFFQKNLTVGLEACIKVGNRYSCYKTYEEFKEDMKEDNYTFDEELSHWVNYYDVKYYVENYLPRW